MRKNIDHVGKATGFDKRDIQEILQAESEYLVEKGIKENNKQDASPMRL